MTGAIQGRAVAGEARRKVPLFVRPRLYFIRLAGEDRGA